MGIVESRRDKLTDGRWWVCHPKWTCELEVSNGIIITMDGEREYPPRWVGRKFVDFVNKFSYGRKNFKVRQIGG